MLLNISGQTSRYLGELGGGEEPKSASHCVGVGEFCEILRSGVIEDFERETQDFVRNISFNGKPVKLLHAVTVYDKWKGFWR